ncbi:MAG: ATP-binding cassette domain-containing protein [Acidimicrobiales bacterium]
MRGVSFSVAPGEIFGFLGRNGAGKSTTVRILTTLLRPTAGWARVLGFDVTAQPEEVRRIQGVALQAAALDELMTGREHLVLAARLTGIAARPAAARAGELLETFGLIEAADRIAAGYSGGMRRRLDVAMALVGQPRVLFLDEPSTGLDPQSRRALWELIGRLRHGGTTVFLTTQYLAEADVLADRVAVVHEGRIAAVGAPSELKDRFGATTLRLRLGGVHAEEQLRRLVPADVVVGAEDGWVVLAVPGGDAAVPALIARLSAEGPAIERLAVVSPTLEDVFVTLTGEGIESSAGVGDIGSVSAVRRGMGIGGGVGR